MKKRIFRKLSITRSQALETLLLLLITLLLLFLIYIV